MQNSHSNIVFRFVLGPLSSACNGLEVFVQVKHSLFLSEQNYKRVLQRYTGTRKIGGLPRISSRISSAWGSSKQRFYTNLSLQHSSRNARAGGAIGGRGCGGSGVLVSRECFPRGRRQQTLIFRIWNIQVFLKCSCGMWQEQYPRDSFLPEKDSFRTNTRT